MKKAERRRIDAFELWCWRRLRVPWTAKRSNQSILKEINLEYSLEGLMLKLKLQYFGHPMRRASLKLNIKKSKDHGIHPIYSWQIEGENVEVVTDFFFLVSKISVDGDCTMKSEDHCFLAGKL